MYAMKRARRVLDGELAEACDDAMLDAENQLRAALIEQSRGMIAMLTSCISEKNAPRALHLIEHVAQEQKQLLTSIALAGVGPKRKKVPLLDAEDSYVTQALDPETYGANAIEQMATTMGQAIGPSKEAKTRDLITALKHAKAADEPELVAEVKKELDALLHPPTSVATLEPDSIEPLSSDVTEMS